MCVKDVGLLAGPKVLMWVYWWCTGPLPLLWRRALPGGLGSTLLGIDPLPDDVAAFEQAAISATGGLTDFGNLSYVFLLTVVVNPISVPDVWAARSSTGHCQSFTVFVLLIAVIVLVSKFSWTLFTAKHVFRSSEKYFLANMCVDRAFQ